MAQTPNESMLMRLSRCNTVLIRYNCDRVRDFLSFANFLCRADGLADIHTLYCEALTELKAAANGNEELITFQSSLTKYLVLPRSNKHQGNHITVALIILQAVAGLLCIFYLPCNFQLLKFVFVPLVLIRTDVNLEAKQTELNN